MLNCFVQIMIGHIFCLLFVEVSYLLGNGAEIDLFPEKEINIVKFLLRNQNFWVRILNKAQLLSLKVNYAFERLEKVHF